MKAIEMSKTVGKWCFCGFTVMASIVLWHIGAFAENQGEENALQLGVVTVTAPGSEQKVEDVQATIEIIDAEKIDSFSGRSLSQVLQQASGVFVADSGSTSSLSIRGFESGQALILVNGMRRTGKYGSTDLNSIQLEDIERIEIVRGPMSALYGSDAMAGIVNIVTKKAADERSLSAKIIGGIAENGDRKTTIVRATGNLGAIGNTHHRLSTEIKRRGDYRIEDDQPYTSLKDEERLFFSYSGDYAANDGHFLRWHAEYGNQDDEGISSSSSLGYPATYEKEDRIQLDAQYRQTWQKSTIDLSVGYGNADTESERTNGPEFTDYDQYEANGVWTLFADNDRHTVSVGAGASHERIELSILTERPDRDVYHGFLQDQWQILNDVTVVGGVRYDHYSDFGDALNPKISLSWTPGNYTARVGYGTAFKAPAYTSMYSYFERSAGRSTSIIYGNPELEPEESQTLEAAVGYRAKRFSLEGVYHFNKLKNLIDAQLTDTSTDAGGAHTTKYLYVNVSKAEISGVELTLTVDILENWQINAAWEYLDKKDDDTNERLTGYARSTAKIGSTISMGGFSLHAYCRWLHDYYGSDPNLPRGSDPVNSTFDVVDVKLDYRLFDHHLLSVGVDNLLDEETPANFTRGGAPLDPGERYYYLGYTINY
jgi:outer membrane receptor for ferrienterochelin and colicins